MPHLARSGGCVVGGSHVPASPAARGQSGLSAAAPGGEPRELEDFQMGAEFSCVVFDSRWEMGAESSAMAREQRGGGFCFCVCKQRCILQIYPYTKGFSVGLSFFSLSKEAKIFFFHIQVFNVLISKKVFNEFTQISIFQIIRRFRYAL